MPIFVAIELFPLTLTPISVFRKEAIAISTSSFFSSILLMIIFVFKDEFATTVISFAFQLEASPIFLAIKQLLCVKAILFLFSLSLLFESISSVLMLLVFAFLVLAAFFPVILFILLIFPLFLFAI